MKNINTSINKKKLTLIASKWIEKAKFKPNSKIPLKWLNWLENGQSGHTDQVANRLEDSVSSLDFCCSVLNPYNYFLKGPTDLINDWYLPLKKKARRLRSGEHGDQAKKNTKCPIFGIFTN